MPSPFPGMNPYLERPALWPDFHGDFIIRLREALVPQVRPRYIVQGDTRVVLDPVDAVEGRDAIDDQGGPPGGTGAAVRLPDLGVHERDAAGSASGGTAVLQAPAVGTLLPTRSSVGWEQMFLEVRRREDQTLVTAIELISPSNKVGRGRLEYRQKRREYLLDGVNVVEIDLLRMAGPMGFGDVPPSSYRAVVARPERMPKVDVWPFNLRDPLPKIPVPLLKPDPDAALDLGPLLHATYDAAGYEDYVYDAPPEPPLTAEDQAWADGRRASAS